MGREKVMSGLSWDSPYTPELLRLAADQKAKVRDVPMSAFGTWRTWIDVRLMSAFGGKADMGRLL